MNFENRTVFDEVMCRLRWLTFFGPPCSSSSSSSSSSICLQYAMPHRNYMYNVRIQPEQSNVPRSDEMSAHRKFVAPSPPAATGAHTAVDPNYAPVVAAVLTAVINSRFTSAVSIHSSAVLHAKLRVGQFVTRTFLLQLRHHQEKSNEVESIYLQKKSYFVTSRKQWVD